MLNILIFVDRFTFLLLFFLVLTSCDYDCLFRPGDAELIITFPTNGDSIDTDEFGFIPVEGITFDVHQQICPNQEEIAGEIFMAVEAPPAKPLFIQKEHTYPESDGNFTISTHLGASKPISGEEFVLTAFAISSADLSIVQDLDTLQSFSELKDIGVNFATSKPIKVIIK